MLVHAQNAETARLKWWLDVVKGLYILLAFFSLIVTASLLIPVPLFPGNWFCSLLGEVVSDYVWVMSAVFNGAFYGVILWSMFVGLGRKLVD